MLYRIICYQEPTKVERLLFEKLKGINSLKRKKHPVRVNRENSFMLNEAATTTYTRKRNVPHFY